MEAHCAPLAGRARRPSVAARALAGVGLLAIVGVLMLPSLPAGPTLDAAVFIVVGERLAVGDLPYRDVFDHKLPGIYLLYLLFASIPIISTWPVAWLASAVAVWLTALAVGRIVGSIAPPAAGVASALLTVLAMTSYPISMGGGLSETFAAPLSAAALLCLLPDRTRRLWPSVAGLLLGLAFTITAFALAGAVALTVLAFMLGGLRRARSLVAGFALVVITVAFGITGIGLAPFAQEALIDYNTAYREAAATGPLSALETLSLANLLTYAQHWAVPLTAAGIGATYTVRRWGQAPSLAGAVLWVVLVAIMIGAGSGRIYGHYMIAAAVPVGVLMGVGVTWLVRWGEAGMPRAVAALAVACLMSGINVAAYDAGTREMRAYISSEWSRLRTVAEFIDRGSPPSSTLLVWGNKPMLYSVADRRPSWRYIYLLPLLTPRYATSDRLEGALEQLRKTPPCLIVDAGSPAPGEPGLPALLVSRPVTPTDRSFDSLDPIRAFVDGEYQVVAIVSGWPVYRRSAGC